MFADRLSSLKYSSHLIVRITGILVYMYTF